MRLRTLLLRLFFAAFFMASVSTPIFADKGGKGHGNGHFKEGKHEAKHERFERRETARIVRTPGYYDAPAAVVRSPDIRGANIRHRGMDRNGDGVITRDEWRGNDRSFEVHDRNRDGVLSGDEVRAGSQARNRDSADRFARLDVNHDGFVSRAEFRNDVLFSRLDINRDQLLTRDEFFGRTDARQFDRFGEMDRNGNGVITPNEWRGSMRDFERLDINRDGVIDRNEFFGTRRY